MSEEETLLDNAIVELKRWNCTQTVEDTTNADAEVGTNTNHVDITEKIKEAYEDSINTNRIEKTTTPYWENLYGSQTKPLDCRLHAKKEKEIASGPLPQTPERMEMKEIMEGVESFTMGQLMLASERMKNRESTESHHRL
ncbi:hypothetical protein JTB14_013846 [Gonioctena quinquepunctata]|nr:hypothetical protein JTB14_013846 [Gonioctena quinquepunctata]